MKKTKIIPVLLLFSISLVSCPPDLLSILQTDDFDTLGDGFFYALDMTTEDFYKVKAEKLYEGEKCVIWAETGSGVTVPQAVEIADEYDVKIRPIITDTFSKKNFTVKYEGRSYPFTDILDCANWLVGRNDRKLTILLLDIKDGFKNPQTDTYVAGYFYAGNFWDKGKIEDTKYYSNGRDMIYVDTNPGLLLDSTQAYATFAHELQHLANFVTRVLKILERTDGDTPSLMDTWIDEGLSSQAEYLYLGKNPESKLVRLADKNNTIKTGNNFFVWDNYKDDPLAILDEYTTVYLFFRWLYLQANTGLRPRIFRDIAYSEYHDYRAVTSVAGGTWENLLRKWLAANYYPGNSYGYTGDAELRNIITNFQEMNKENSILGNTIQLYPGEGVYSTINGTFFAQNTGNIRYAGLGISGVINTGTSLYTEDTLLTFNANTDNSKERETGYLAGVTSSITVSPPTANSRQAGTRTRPYVMDARDLMGRDKELPSYRLPR